MVIIMHAAFILLLVAIVILYCKREHFGPLLSRDLRSDATYVNYQRAIGLSESCNTKVNVQLPQVVHDRAINCWNDDVPAF